MLSSQNDDMPVASSLIDQSLLQNNAQLLANPLLDNDQPPSEGIPTALTQEPDPGHAAAIDRAAEEALHGLAKRSTKALNVIDEVLDGAGRPQDRLGAAFGVLDRIAADRRKQLEIEVMREKNTQPVVHITLTDETAKRLLNATSRPMILPAERNVTPAEDGQNGS